MHVLLKGCFIKFTFMITISEDFNCLNTLQGTVVVPLIFNIMACLIVINPLMFNKAIANSDSPTKKETKTFHSNDLHPL